MLIKRLERAVIRATVNPILRTYGSINNKHYNIENTIVVASSARGGSTWLAEIIGSLPGYPILFEPLNPNRNPNCKKYGFTSLTYVPASVEDPIKQDYLQQVFTGANLSSRLALLENFRPEQYLGFRGFLVKFISANLLLYWAMHQFPLRAIFMVRHPCAVVSSQLHNPQWGWAKNFDWAHNIKSNLIPQNLLVDYPHLAEIHRNIKTVEEGLALGWAVRNYVPLSQPKPHPWYLTTYERLVIEGQHEVDRLFKFLGQPVPREAYERLKVPSITTQSGSNPIKGINQLSTWREKLTTRQIDLILNVVNQVGIDFYSDAIEPDYKKLFS